MPETEPKGDCPFCSAPKWHICDHFLGYVKRGRVETDGRTRITMAIPANAIRVHTGVSVRAYVKTVPSAGRGRAN